jgi:hypothetical protein
MSSHSLSCRYEYDGEPEHIHAYRETPRTGNVAPPEWIKPPKPDFSDASKRRMERCAADPESCARKTQYGDFSQPRRTTMEDFDADMAQSASQFQNPGYCSGPSGKLCEAMRSNLRAWRVYPPAYITCRTPAGTLGCLVPAAEP